MKNNLAKLKKLVIGNINGWIKQFNVDDYINNQPMIEKLYEEKQTALISYFEIENKVESCELEIKRLTRENQELKSLQKNIKQRSLINFSLNIIATVLIGIGVNIISAAKIYFWTGWIMVGVAIILEIISFINLPRKGEKWKS